MHGDYLLKTLSGVDDASVGGLGAEPSCSNAARCSLPCEYSHTFSIYKSDFLSQTTSRSMLYCLFSY